jgi:hypothetical protein
MIRRKQRKADTKIEVMERRMDRAIENKEKVTIQVMGSIVQDYAHLIRLIRELETALTDAMIVFSTTR